MTGVKRLCGSVVGLGAAVSATELGFVPHARPIAAPVQLMLALYEQLLVQPLTVGLKLIPASEIVMSLVQAMLFLAESLRTLGKVSIAES